MINTIGQREAERALQLGHLYSGEEALKVGLIDELVSPAEMEAKVQAQLKTWLRVPPKARAITKHLLRKDVAERLINNKQKDVEGRGQYLYMINCFFQNLAAFDEIKIYA
jgi:3,2-trans-enoyl-CoA isomerase